MESMFQAEEADTVDTGHCCFASPAERQTEIIVGGCKPQRQGQGNSLAATNEEEGVSSLKMSKVKPMMSGYEHAG